MAKRQFKAESKRLLDLMINSIYTNHEIFLREILSNASDAIDKLCYLSLTDESVGLDRADFRIDVLVDEKARTVTVRDNGIGMTLEEAENNLGVIARSGSFRFKGEMDKTKAEDLSIIGQFGVGFYSAFMVADEVTVLSRRYGEEKGVRWTSTGADGYTVTEIDRDAVGTEVVMHLKPDDENESYGRFLDPWTLRALIKKYSDYVRWPIHMAMERSERVETGEKDEEGQPRYEYRRVTADEIVNSMVPIWQRAKSEVKDEDCLAWYREKYHDRKDPCALIRTDAEGSVSYKAMLFVPGEEIEELFTGERKSGVTLYANGVMVMDGCDKLLHPYFDFVRGVVDSPDLSLNISRELLQHDRQLQIIGRSLEKKIKAELEKLMKNDRGAYEDFFRRFGGFLKAGVCDEYGSNKEFLRELLLFYTGEDKLVTLKEYLDAMPDSQSAVYYACADTLRHAMSLPQCEQVRRRGFAILYLTGPLDEMVLQLLREQDGKPFVNVVTDELGFETEEEKTALEAREKESRALLDFVKESLQDKVHAVRLSRKLTDLPCCLTTDGGITLEMERYFRQSPSEEMRQMRAERVLELNGDHPAVLALQSAWEAGDRDKAAQLAAILETLAAMMAGCEIEDPAAFAAQVSSLF